MVQYFISMLQALMQAARDTYNVDPVVFLVIYLVSMPVFYYSAFRLIRAIGKRLGTQIALWSAIFLCANVGPYVYVLIFGRNLPWWVYGILTLLIGLCVYALISKLRANRHHKPLLVPIAVGIPLV